MKHQVPFVIFGCLVLFSFTIACQEIPGFPQQAARVRISIPCDSIQSSNNPKTAENCIYIGSLVRATFDSVIVESEGKLLPFELKSPDKFEISKGKKSHTWTGAGVGFIAGIGTGYAILHTGGSTALCNRSANQDALRIKECAGLTIAGGLVGAGLGALIGKFIQTEKWEKVSIDNTSIRLLLFHSNDLALTFSVKF